MQQERNRPVIITGNGLLSSIMGTLLGSETAQVIRKKIVRTRNKQSLAESEAKISACARKQAVKRRNRFHQYAGSIVGNPCTKRRTLMMFNPDQIG